MDALPCVRRCSWWVPVVRGENHFFAWTHFLACKDVAGGSQQSGGRIVFSRTHFLACEDVARGSQQSGGESFFCEIRWPVWWVLAVRGKRFFSQNTGGPSGGSPMSGGGIIIFRIIRRHFLAAAMDPTVSLSTYSTLPMEVGR